MKTVSICSASRHATRRRKCLTFGKNLEQCSQGDRMKTKKMKILLSIYLLGVVLLCLFPPWQTKYKVRHSLRAPPPGSWVASGYRPIWDSGHPLLFAIGENKGEQVLGHRVDACRLTIQLIALTAAAACAWLVSEYTKSSNVTD